MGGIGYADRERPPRTDIPGRAVILGQAEHDLIRVVNAAPCGIHGIGRTVLVVGRDNQHRHGVKPCLLPEILSHSLISS